MQGSRIVLHAAGGIQLERFDVPTPGSDQVLVKIDTTTVSAGTVVNMIKQRRGGPQGSFPQAGLGCAAIPGALRPDGPGEPGLAGCLFPLDRLTHIDEFC